MGLVLKISLRNLLRQKRRNLLLGLGITVGTALFVLASAFAEGVSDTLFNRIIVNVVGHVSIVPAESGKRRLQIVRDLPRFKELVRANVPGLKEMRETAAVFCRVVGNGKSESTVLVGVDWAAGAWRGFNITAGNVAEMTNGKYEFPIMLYEDRARDLGLKLLDQVSARFRTVKGAEQSATFTVVVLARAASAFDSFPMWVPLPVMKRLLDYKPHEAGQLYVILNQPKTARQVADVLHAKLAPGPLAVHGRAGANRTGATMLGYRTNEQAVAAMAAVAGVPVTALQAAARDGGVLVSAGLAASTGAGPGATMRFEWTTKYLGEQVSQDWRIMGVFPGGKDLGGPVVLVPEYQFFEPVPANLPANEPGAVPAGFILPKSGSPAWSALAPEWDLLPRTASTEAFQKKQREINTGKWLGTRVDVRTMFETASAVLSLEGALNMITAVAVLVLIFIVLIGVVNTLRMTIRERTREIGTMRAIGMRRVDVRNTFLTETFFLALFSTVSGVMLGLLGCWLLSLPRIDTTSAFGVLLNNGHLQFVPTVGDAVSAVVLILAITMLTAWFPSRRAARLSAADALRHYE